jgi:hypothetical protein
MGNPAYIPRIHRNINPRRLPISSARVERTLLSAAFDLDFDFALTLPDVHTAPRSTVEERRFSAA